MKKESCSKNSSQAASEGKQWSTFWVETAQPEQFCINSCALFCILKLDLINLFIISTVLFGHVDQNER